jgi:polysaccharide biosynthesis/export protein
MRVPMIDLRCEVADPIHLEMRLPLFCVLASVLVIFCGGANAQEQQKDRAPDAQSGLPSVPPAESTQDYNQRLEKLRQQFAERSRGPESGDYRIGPQDLLDINVFEAAELNRSVRVSENGEVSLPLLSGIQVEGLTARQLENVLAERMREFVKDPHVSVMVTAVESHPISVIGEVNKPGVFQVRGSKTLLEMLSMAQGLAPEAGDEVMVMRNAGSNHMQESGHDVQLQGQSAGPAATVANETSSTEPRASIVSINLRHLLNSRDPTLNVPVYAGDIVKVTHAGIVYVVGAVKKPGGFTLRGSEQMSLLKAIALAEGLSNTSAKSRTRIIRTDESTGKRSEIAVDMGKILDGKQPDMNLQTADIVFVPSSAGKTAMYRGADAAVTAATGLLIFHP